MKIRDIIEIEKHFTKNKKTPCDIAEALEEERYSESKGQDIKLGDMHLEARTASERASDPGLKPQATRTQLETNCSSDKNPNPQASSDKLQAPSCKHQAPSRKRQAP